MGPLDGKIDWKNMTNHELMEAKNNIRYVNNPELKKELDNRISTVKGKIKESEVRLTDNIQKFKQGHVAKIDFSKMTDDELYDSSNEEKYAGNEAFKKEIFKRMDKTLERGERIDPLVEIDFSKMTDDELFDSSNKEKYAGNEAFKEEFIKRMDKILEGGERIDPLVEKVNRFDEPSRVFSANIPKTTVTGRIKKEISGFFDIFRPKKK